jgi:LAS superfamily LD-carboxypeptidase LdcB
MIRVRVRDYGRIASPTDPRLRFVPSVPGRQCLLHWAAAADLAELELDWCATGQSPLLVASGWRPHRWASRAAYEAALVRRYGSVERGRVYLAYDSPHETGLAADFGSHGLEPRSATTIAQRETVAYQWLVAHAGDHGYRPYEPEPWHWEFVGVSREGWLEAPP